MIHFPTSPADVKHARRRFVYEELLLFQLKMLGMKKERKEAEKGVAIDYDLDKVKDFIATLPFELTGAQKRVVNELCAELKSPIADESPSCKGMLVREKRLLQQLLYMQLLQQDSKVPLWHRQKFLLNNMQLLLLNGWNRMVLRLLFLAGSTKAKARKTLLEKLADRRNRFVDWYACTDPTRCHF